MNESIFDNRATSNSSLEKRLMINTRSSTKDFQAWLFKNLKIDPEMKVLEVGCGSGAQSRILSRLVGAHGQIIGIDKSAESVKKTEDELVAQGNFRGVVGDMDRLKDIIRDDIAIKTFDLAMSVYALYYANFPMNVLDVMKKSLRSGGVLAVATPIEPHGMVDFVKSIIGSLTPEIDRCLNFAWNALIPYFRKNLSHCSVFFFKNELRIENVEDFLYFYRETTYYSQESEKQVVEEVQKRLQNRETLNFEKNGVLLVGTKV